MIDRKEVALVTGASSGIGLAIARQLGARGADLIIAARRRDKLEALKGELSAAHGIRVDVVESDLAQGDGAKKLYDRVRALRQDVTIVVNNAGFGKQATVLEHSLEEIRDMIQVNMTALTELTRLFAADMKATGYGRFLQVASIGAFQPAPMYAVYSAAKAYVLSFSYAMNHELKGSGVSITTVCPGVTESEFHAVAGHEKTGMMKMMTMTSEQLAKIALRAMFKRKPKRIPGFANKFNSLLMEGLPRAWSTSIAAAAMKK